MATLIFVIVLVLLVAAVVAFALRSRRRAQLQHRFGPEYDRRVAKADNRRQAEQELTQVAQRRDQLELHDLDPRQRARFAEQWTVVQTRFVDEPASSVDDAATLLDEVLRARGYPADDFESQADLISADHPDVVQHYRSAHAAHERHRESGAADTEDLRQAFVHYRDLFESLTGGHDGQHAAPADRPAPTETDRTDAAHLEETR